MMLHKEIGPMGILELCHEAIEEVGVSKKQGP